MKKRISLICLLAAVLAAVVFCALWQSAAQDRSALRPLCSAVYGGLLITPERAREHLPEILDTIRLLAADVTDENAFVHLSELSSALEE